MIKEIVKGGSLILTSVIVAKVFSLIYTPVLARYLGPSGLGIYNLALVMLPWFVTLISLSLSTLVAQLVAENKNEKDLPAIITTCVSFTGILSIFGAVIHFFAARIIAVEFFNMPGLIPYIRIASLCIATAIFYNNAIGIARGLKNFKLYLNLEIIKSFMLVALGLFFLLVLKYRIKGALIAMVLAPLVSSIVLLWKYKKYIQRRIKWEIIRLSLRLGSWITLLSLLLTILMTVDKFLLGVYTDPKTVGLYVAVASITTAISLIPSSFKGSILPFISENFKDKEKIKVMVERILVYALILVSCAVIVFVGFREEIVLLIFGRQFISAVKVIPVLALTLLPYTVYIIIQSVILDRRLIKKATIVLIPILLIALTIDIILTKRFGMIGAGCGILISHTMVSSMYLIMLKKEFNFEIKRIIYLVGLIIFSMGSAYSLPGRLAVRIILFLVIMLIYSGIIYLMKYITETEVRLVINKIKRSFL